MRQAPPFSVAPRGPGSAGSAAAAPLPEPAAAEDPLPPAQDIIPVRRRFVTARPDGDGDGLTLKRRLARKAVRLNRTGGVIWSMCDGRTPVASMFAALARTFQSTDDSIRLDVMATLFALENNGLLTFKGRQGQAHETRTVDLRQIPFYVINLKADSHKRESMRRQLTELGLRFEFVEATQCQPGSIGIAISHLRILGRKDIETPFGVLEDDCVFNERFRHRFMVPANTDAFYLGASRYGIAVPGQLSWGRQDYVKWSHYDRNNLRVFNMLARHAVLYLREEFRRAALEAMIEALTSPDHMFPGDVGLATTHLSHLVLTPPAPICYQAKEFGGQQFGTETPLPEL